MRSSLIIILILYKITTSYAYVSSDSLPDRPKNNININIGKATLIALNYERMFFIKPNAFIAASIGAGYTEDFQLCIFGCDEGPKSYLIIPHHLTFNIGSPRKLFEIGIGGAAVYGDPDNKYLIYPILGYRFQPLKKLKLNFRVSLSFPVFNYSPSFLFFPHELGTGFGF